MTLILKTDPSHPGGGFALLKGVTLNDVSSVTIENGFSGQFLGEDGKWGRNPFAFPVEQARDGCISLGPHIVDHVPTEMPIELRTGDGRPLGKLFWTDVIPSRNPGSVTSAQVLEERRRRAQRHAADETAALARITARAAEEQAAKERAAKERSAREEAALAEQERVAAETRATADAEDARSRATAKEDDAKRTAAPIRAAVAAAPILAAAPSTLSSASRHRTRWPLLVLLILLPLAAGAAALALRPDLLRLARQPDDRGTTTPPAQSPTPSPPVATPEPKPEPPAPEPPKSETPKPETPEPEPAHPEPIKPDAPKPVDCTTFDARVAALQGRSDPEKVALGEEALHAGCGSEAFQAFDASDPQVSEAAAWNLARFYDPNESDPVYRGAAAVHPDYAAAYYRLWRDRSPRQAKALARICDADGSAASLRRSCGR